MRKRRRTKYYWLPTYGTPNSGDPTIFSTSQQLALTVTATDIVTGWTPIVVNDQPQNVFEENFPLNDIIGNEYVIKRIVGKCPVDVSYTLTGGNANVGVLPPIIVGAGFYVARVDRVANNFNPVDSTDASTLYNPLNSSLQREPWIWRRTWILGPGAAGAPQYLNFNGSLTAANIGSTTPIIGQAAYPLTNIAYGSVLDGPHIDAKTGRRVRQDEQVFFGFAAHYYPFASNPVADLVAQVAFHPDVRVLGALRRAKNRSNF